MTSTIRTFVLTLTLFLTAIGIRTHAQSSLEPFAPSAQAALWVEETLAKMSAEERIGQLFMVAAYSNRDEKHYKEIERLIRDYHIGGLIFFQDVASRQLELTNRYQHQAKIPLLIGFDGEWGLSMRLKNTQKFPRQMTLGAIQDNEHIYKMGAAIARQCKRMGIHVNFAPVIDVNVNPANPVIGMRSFGENKYNVSDKGMAYMDGLQDNGVLACGKHFPGHGDTDVDSHKDLPTILHSRERMDSIELYPFKQLIADSLASIMVAHIHIPAYDTAKNTATTLSHNVVTDLLKKEMGFQGLIFTDALNMKGVSKYYEPGETDLKALLAGNDVLLFPLDVGKAVHQIQKALRKGTLTSADIDDHVRKILYAKHKAGLAKYKDLNPKNLYQELNSADDEALIYDLYKSALTVVKDQHNWLPIKETSNDTLASLSFYAPGKQEELKLMRDKLDFYAPFQHYDVNKKFINEKELDELLNKVKNKKHIIITWHGTSRKSKDQRELELLKSRVVEKIAPTTKMTFVLFGNPYALKSVQHFSSVICAYENNKYTLAIVPQLIFGAIGANGRLPVSPSNRIKAGEGLTKQAIGRVGFAPPELVEVNSSMLKKIDEIAFEAIKTEATPGCQIMVLRQGKIIYEKNMGHYTYDRTKKIDYKSIYDVASVTKVVATMQAVMKLYEEGKLDIDKKMKDYFPELKGSNKENMILREIMAHQAGLYPYLVHWRRGWDTEKEALDSLFFRKETISGQFEIKVADSLYVRNDIRDSIWKWTVDSELIKKDKKTNKYPYKYSDLGFYIMKRLVEQISGEPLEDYLRKHFYGPMGLRTLTYLPLLHYDKSLICPTENDELFRKQLLQGYVHDPGAAMMGGVAGHAGIFSNARELSKILQMHLWNGTYAGKKYFNTGTLSFFTKRQYDENRRGIGWDKCQPEGKGPTGEYCSLNTYGHSGFTGTGVWVDSDYDLIYIFLSNRVYPDANNKKLLKTDVRTRVQDVIYEAILEQEQVKMN